MRLWHRGFVGSLVALALAGCVMSPIPEPPQASIDANKVFHENNRQRGTTIILGDPGAATPAGALIRVYHLESPVERAEGIVAENGSFFIDLIVSEGDELRFQIITDAMRADPIDLIAGPAESSFVVAERPLADCLLLDPPKEIDLESDQTVSVENRCPQDVQIEAPVLRRDLSGIEIGVVRSWPEVVASGGSVTIEVQVQPGWDIEEVFFIEASSPERDRRPITFVPP